MKWSAFQGWALPAAITVIGILSLRSFDRIEITMQAMHNSLVVVGNKLVAVDKDAGHNKESIEENKKKIESNTKLIYHLQRRKK